MAKRSVRARTAYTYLNGSRQYLAGAVKVGDRVFYEFTHDLDLAYKFTDKYKARTARELLNDGRRFDGRMISVKKMSVK